MHFSHIVITAFMATMVAAAPKQGKTSVFDLAARDPAVLSIGTSPGCGAYCPTCGDETCTCGSTDAASKAPCCNGYRSSAKNLPGCAQPSITGNPNTHGLLQPTAMPKRPAEM